MTLLTDISYSFWGQGIIALNIVWTIQAAGSMVLDAWREERTERHRATGPYAEEYLWW